MLFAKSAEASVSPSYPKYFFPSKMIDYLSSGTPTITCRLKGIPDEYYDYCYVTDSDDESGLKNKIVEVCEKDEADLLSLGNRAKKFINSQKIPGEQCARLFNMLENT